MSNEEKAEEFKRRLIFVLKNKNLNNADLARLINKTPPAISKYFKNKTMPPLQIIKEMSEALEIPIEFLNLEIEGIEKEIINKAKIEKLKKQMEKEVEQEMKKIIKKTKTILKEMEKLANEIDSTRQ